jgi:hypothetical protein
MFGNALHMSFGPRARRLAATGFRPARGVVTRFIVEAAWFTLVVALFLAWLMSGPDSDSVSGRGPACVSFGRGGALCSDPAPADRSPGLSARDSGCASLGKGGRVCFARPTPAGP